MATEIRKTVADYSAIPKPSADDVQLLKDAKQTLKQLEGSARDRVELLSECADRAKQVDKMLRDDREQSRIAQKRDDAGGRLRALLSGAELMSPSAHSDSVDTVRSRVEAFREVRDLMRIDPHDTSADETPGEQTFFTRVRRETNDMLRRFGL
jgi:hypothetical protein